MPIVIPEARSVIPQITPQARPDGRGLAEALAPAARNVSAALSDWAQQEDAAALNRARLAAAEALGAERQAAEEATEFDGLTAGFDQRARSRIAEIGASLPGRLQERFSLSAEEMRLGHMAGVQKRERGLRLDYGRTALGQQLTGLAAQVAAAPDETARGAIMDQAFAALEEAQATGLITPAEMLTKAEELGAETGETLILRAMREDPAALAEKLQAGAFPQISGPRRERYLSAATAEVERRTARAAREQEIAADRERRALARDVSNTIEILRSGGVPDGLAALQDRVAGTDMGRALDVAVSASRERGGFAELSPAGQREALATLDGVPVPMGDAGKVELARRRELLEIHRRTVQAVQADPMGFALKRGIVALPAATLPMLADPAALGQRVDAAASFRRRYGGPARIFSDAERDGLIAQIQRLPADGQLSVAAGLAGLGGDRAMAVLRELGQDSPLWVHAGGLALSGASDAGQAVLTGMRALADKDAPRPQKPTRDLARAALLAEAMAPGSEGLSGRLMEAALAHYAATAAGVDPADRAEQGRALAASIQAVAGQRVVNGVVTGGFQVVNGRQTYLPPGIAADAVERRINLFGRAGPAALRPGSVGGGLPAGADGRPYLPRRPVLLAKGGGRYLLAEQRNGKLVRLLDSVTGGDFEIDLRKLLADELPADVAALPATGGQPTTRDMLQMGGPMGPAMAIGSMLVGGDDAADDTLADRLRRDGK